VKYFERGQALIILPVLIPLLLTIFGVIAYVGATSLAHDRIENHCDKKILDSLEAQGRALSLLGKINPFARTIIISRRAIDPLANAGIPYFVAIQKSLSFAQKVIGRSQKIIEKGALAQSLVILSTPAPRDFLGKIVEQYRPRSPKLYIEPESLFENEDGPPLQPEENFDKKQTVSGSIRVFTKKFLTWDKKLKADDMKLVCKGKITMDRLEDKWTAQLTAPPARP
jgi:hypothetical protein